ncbi:MAG: hypothetical protein P8R54_04320 [Myxococcota bacterium]|nr:hypothetical protein [Myxococcota bacterium]
MVVSTLIRTLVIFYAVVVSVLFLSYPSSAVADGVPALYSESSSVYVIVHPEVDLDVIDFDELRAILLGKNRYWSGGEQIQLVINGRPDSTARQVWLEDVTEMSEMHYTQYWVGMVFRGRALSAPHIVPDIETAMALVAALPGAISLVDGRPTSGVQVLNVTNTPGRTRYNTDL